MKRCRKCEVGDAGDAPARGPYANLCRECRSERGRNMASRRTPGQRDDRRAVDGLRSETYEAKAKTLISHGRQLDRAIRDVRTLELQRGDALRLLWEASEGWRTACLRLAGAVERG